MRTRLIPFIAALIALAAAAAARQQWPLRMVSERLVEGPMRIEKIKDGLYVIRGPFLPCTPRGCTPNGPDDGLIHEPGDVAARVAADGVILVDNKFPEHVPQVLALLRTVTPLPIRYVLNSHHHGDHVAGNVQLIGTGPEVVAHRNIREHFLRLKQPGPPNVTFADQASVHLGDAEARLYNFGPAHTNGDTVIHFPDLRTIHVGDLIVDGMPVIDYASGGSALRFIDTIDRLLELDFDTMIPGHGRVMTRDDALAYRARFQAMNDRARSLIRSGVPKDQFAARLALDDFGWADSVSTTTFLRSVSQYYDELAAAR